MKDGRVILITGCSTGIGRELCEVLFNAGHKVVATARNADSLKELSASLKLSLDVTKEESIHEAINEVISRFHKIDILVNNAGYSMRGALEEIDVKLAKDMFDVNVFGIIQMVQAVVPKMRKQKSGKIINIGSISGKFAQPINGAYCASKFAVEALSDALRLELHSNHIQVTVIEPGPMNTNFFKTLDNNSNALSSDPNSFYARFYESDARNRKKQKLTESKHAAITISDIMMKSRLKARYQVAVPFSYNMITYFPDSLKEYILKNR